MRYRRLQRSLARSSVAALTIALVITACGGPTGSNPPPPGDTVANTLAALGIDTDPSPRLAPDGTTLDDDSAPLGAAASYGDPEEFSDDSAANTSVELVIARNYFDHDTLHVEEIIGANVTAGGTIDMGTVSVLADLSTGNGWVTPVDDDADQFLSLRDIASGDLDGDGFDEIAAAYVDEDDLVLKLRVFDDDAAAYAATTTSLAAGADILGVKLIALDDDGNGVADLVVALTYDDRVDIVPIARASGGYVLDDAGLISVAQEMAGSTMYVRMAAGQLDYDNGIELAAVINEADISGSDSSGTATLYVFDDANAGRTLLSARSVQANLGGVVAAAAADVALGDIDGDGLDEVVVAGATNLAWHCDDEFSALVIAYDDAVNDLVQLGATEEDLVYSNCPAFNSWKRFFVFVTTPDLDGDGVSEITANHVVFHDFASYAPFTPYEGVALLPRLFLDDTHDAGQYLSVATTAVVAGDVTGDGREDLMVYHQNRTIMEVWGLSAVTTVGPNDNGWAQLSAVVSPGQHNSQATARPLLVTANLDTDGPLLRYGEGSYELVFTEPILIAALAAPPCQNGIAQNLGACVTKFGQGTSQTVDASLSVTVKASVTAGIETSTNVPFVGDFGASMKKTVTAEASVWAGLAYTVEKTITYSTGALEDGVVFTSVPYDIYRYDILSHPDPELVGKQVVIRVPREPVTMIAEREFFNQALGTDGPTIAANVFDHTPGDVDSYPSVSRKSSLLAQHGGGLEFGPSGVGQGSGDTELSIAVSDEVSAGGSLAISYEKTVEATAGVVMGGFSIGYGAEASLSITSGEQTTYTGTVGSIAASDYAANAYQWGIFTYVQSVGGQKVEVINYWVD